VFIIFAEILNKKLQLLLFLVFLAGRLNYFHEFLKQQSR